MAGLRTLSVPGLSRYRRGRKGWRPVGARKSYIGENWLNPRNIARACADRDAQVLVDGGGQNGLAVAACLGQLGVDTTIIQRGSTAVVSIEPGVKRMVSIGFKWDIGEDETGHQMKYRRRCGGYYLDAGCAQLMIDGEIGLLRYDKTERFVPEGALLKDGTIQPADLLVLATGYNDQQTMVRRLLVDDIADRVGQVWVIDQQGEMANMFKRTAQPGLWLMGVGLTQSRIYSKYVTLQIKAIELGYISP